MLLSFQRLTIGSPFSQGVQKSFPLKGVAELYNPGNREPVAATGPFPGAGLNGKWESGT